MILLVLWLLGLLGSIGGGFIHLLLVVAAIVLIMQLVSGSGRPKRAETQDREEGVGQVSTGPFHQCATSPPYAGLGVSR